jgi:hypothetical protein
MGLSLPIPLRLLFAAQPWLLAPLLHVIHRVIAGNRWRVKIGGGLGLAMMHCQRLRIRLH